MKRNVPCGKGNSEIGPALVLMLLVYGIIAMVCSYFGINPF